MRRIYRSYSNQLRCIWSVMTIANDIAHLAVLNSLLAVTFHVSYITLSTNAYIISIDRVKNFTPYLRVDRLISKQKSIKQ